MPVLINRMEGRLNANLNQRLPYSFLARRMNYSVVRVYRYALLVLEPMTQMSSYK